MLPGDKSSLQVVARLGCRNMFEFQSCIREGSAGRAVMAVMTGCFLVLDTGLGGRAVFLMLSVMKAA